MSFADVSRFDAPDLDADVDDETSSGGCQECGGPLTGRQKSFCSDRCRKRASRSSNADVSDIADDTTRPDNSSKLKALFKPGTSAAANTNSNRKARPRSSGKRTDASDTLGGLWGLVGSYLVPRVSPAAGRGMQFVAPAAGPILDGAIAGSPLDKMVFQRVAGIGKKAAGAKELLTIPALMFMLERKPELIMDPTFQKTLRGAVTGQLSTVVEAMRKQKALEAELQEAAYHLGMTEDPNADIIDQIIRDLVGPIYAPPVNDAPIQRDRYEIALETVQVLFVILFAISTRHDVRGKLTAWLRDYQAKQQAERKAWAMQRFEEWYQAQKAAEVAVLEEMWCR